jgi:hypothetical protein
MAVHVTSLRSALLLLVGLFEMRLHLDLALHTCVAASFSPHLCLRHVLLLLPPPHSLHPRATRSMTPFTRQQHRPNKRANQASLTLSERRGVVRDAS